MNTHVVGTTAFTRPQTMDQPHGLQVVKGEDPQVKNTTPMKVQGVSLHVDEAKNKLEILGRET